MFPDTPVVMEFEMPESVFFVMEGEVEIKDDDTVIRKVVKGELFAEEGVVCGVTTPVQATRHIPAPVVKPHAKLIIVGILLTRAARNRQRIFRRKYAFSGDPPH